MPKLDDHPAVLRYRREHRPPPPQTWEADRFRQAQLLLPDQPNEPALLALLEAHIPRNAWLVTYNGRGFDWPLLVARYRMARRDPPVHAGHLDLLRDAIGRAR